MDNDQVIIKLFYSFSSPQKKEKNPENPCHKIITKFEETAGGLAKADTVPPLGFSYFYLSPSWI
jgi:hypothetical protein